MKVIKLKGEAKVKKADELISLANGRFFSATFIKKDGTIRTGQFRTGVAKHVKGVGLNYNPKDYGLRGVYEPNNAEGFTGDEAYRNINLATLTMLKVDGEEYRFEN
jgi:hypothetical protein